MEPGIYFLIFLILTLVALLFWPVARTTRAIPKCAGCGQPATCIDEDSLYLCDECSESGTRLGQDALVGGQDAHPTHSLL